MPARKAVPAALFTDAPAAHVQKPPTRKSRAKVTVITLEQRVAQWLPGTGKVRRQGEEITDWGKDNSGQTVALRTPSGVYPFPA
jgi:hypothetical protein